MAVAALKKGVVDFVEKPFDPRMLLDSVSNASRRASVNRERRVGVAEIEACGDQR